MSIKYLSKNKAKLTVSVGSRGNRKQFTKTITYSGKKDAEKQHGEFQAEVRGGNTSNMTVEELLEWYINAFELSGGKKTTATSYRRQSKPLISFFKGRKAKDVTTYHVDRYITLSAKKLAPKTIKNRVSLLSASYKKAMRNGILYENPCEMATLPRVEQKKIDVVSTDDLPDFLKALHKEDNLDLKCAIGFALFCGTRCSELLALTKKDVDLEGKSVNINKSRHVIKKESIVQTPKTKSSYRTIALPDFFISDLKELYARHDSFYELYGQGTEYIIQNGYGEPANQKWVESRLKDFLERNKLSHTTIHALRHTHASMLIDNGFEVVEVSHQLGHSLVSTTLNIYSHLLTDASVSSKKAAEMFSEKWASNGLPNNK